MKTCSRCHETEVVGIQTMCASCKKEYDTEHAKRKYNLRRQAKYDREPQFKCPKCFKGVFNKSDKKKNITKKWCNTCDLLVDLDDENKHKEGRLIDHKIYANKEKVNVSESQKQYYIDNRDLMKAKSKKWKKDNPEKAKAHNIKWQSKNNIDNSEYQKKWRKDNPEILSMHAGKRRAIKLNKVIELTEMEKEEILCTYRQAYHKGLHVDHIIPLQGKLPDGKRVMGLHTPTNLQLLDRKENLSKGNRISYEELAKSIEGRDYVHVAIDYFDHLV